MQSVFCDCGCDKRIGIYAMTTEQPLKWLPYLSGRSRKWMQNDVESIKIIIID